MSILRIQVKDLNTSYVFLEKGDWDPGVLV